MIHLPPALRRTAKVTASSLALLILIEAQDCPAEPHVAHADQADQAVSGILSERIPGAERIEGRLLAPCCWNQTLDTHGSEIAYALRREIRTRLKAGETPAQVEADLIDRYGPRLRAVPDGVPLEGAALLGWAGIGLAGVGLAVLLVRWRRARTLSAPAAAEAVERDALDERLDAELRRLD